MNKWDERYQVEEFIFGTEPHEFLKRVQPYLPKSGRALDLATGEGRNGVYLAQQGLKVEGVDTSAVGVAKAQKMAALKNVAFDAKVADITQMVMPVDTYAVISMVFCHFSEPIRSELAQKIMAALHPDGLFIGVYYHPEQAELVKGPKDATILTDLVGLQTAFSGLKWLIAEHHRQGLGDDARSVIYLLGQKI